MAEPFRATPGGINVPNFGNDAGDLYLKAFAAPGAAIAGTRDYYGAMKAEADRAAAAAANNATEQARIAESRRQYETSRTTPQWQLVPGEGGEQYTEFVGGRPTGKTIGGVKPYTSGFFGPEGIKTLFDTASEVQGLDAQITAMNRAKELIPLALSGFGAGTRTAIGTALPADIEPYVTKLFPGVEPEIAKAKATAELLNILTPASIQAMAPILKGSVSQGELDTAIRQWADPSMDPALRTKIVDAAILGLTGQKRLTEAKLNAMAGGRGMAAPSGATPPPPPTQPPPGGGGGPTVPGPAQPAANTLSAASTAGLKASLARDPSPANRAAIKAKLEAAHVDPTPYGL